MLTQDVSHKMQWFWTPEAGKNEADDTAIATYSSHDRLRFETQRVFLQ